VAFLVAKLQRPVAASGKRKTEDTPNLRIPTIRSNSGVLLALLDPELLGPPPPRISGVSRKDVRRLVDRLPENRESSAVELLGTLTQRERRVQIWRRTLAADQVMTLETADETSGDSNLGGALQRWIELGFEDEEVVDSEPPLMW
jgi:hypothetical protein